MDNRVLLLGGAAVVAIGAAFAAGHYMSQPESPPPIASAQTTPAAPPPAAEPAPSTQPEEAAPAPAAPAPVVKVKPPKRVADYASGEDEYAPPPPPPPPPHPPAEFGDNPNTIAGQFNTFPMRHSGAGTISSPLTFQAQTALGNDREADLRISILVPQPSPNDRGQFWREWGGRDQADLMPDITRGTPVIVTGSASVVVTVDPEILDLDAPAILTLSGRDGQRIYRSRDVAPARGEAWDSRGARWIFVPDAEFYDLLRDGADASISVRNRIDGRSIRIPFDTSDFPPSARRFERIVSQRIDDFAEAWNRARPGAPPPVNRPSGPPVILPPPVNNPPQRPPVNNGHFPRDHGHGHAPGENAGPAKPPVNPPANTPATAPAQPPRTAMSEKLVADYRPPADSCGARGAYPATTSTGYLAMNPAQRASAKATLGKIKAWTQCRASWLQTYTASVNALGSRIAIPGQQPTTALMTVKGGPAVVTALASAKQGLETQQKLIAANETVFAKIEAQPATPAKPRPGTRPPRHHGDTPGGKIP
jgi:hypothetical protein